MSATMSLATTAPRIPLWLKLAFTAFMAVMVPVYLYYYGWTNFLYFCDIAMVLTLIGIWKESPLLFSMSAIGIIVPQMIWVADFVGTAIGYPVVHMTTYMFNSSSSLLLRGLSLFHGWLPFLLIYLVAKVGYDRRGLLYWSVLALALVLVCFFFMPPPNPNAGLTPVNINYVFGFNDAAAQTLVPAWAWVTGMLVVMPILFFLPVHLLFSRWMPKAPVATGK
jgi:hypothetical protein